MKATQAFRLTSIAFAAALTAASSAHATSWFGFEGGSQLINCALGECFRPPDTMGAVGTTQFLETANGYIRIYDNRRGIRARLGVDRLGRTQVRGRMTQGLRQTNL